MGVYRKLFHAEASLYLEHLLRLDPESRHARFSGSMSDAAIRRTFEASDWHGLTLFGFFCDGVLRGVAEIRYEPRLFPDSAELAFSVERPYQSSRVGTTLLQRALVILGNRGIRRAHIVCLLGNSRMQRLALKHRSFVQASRGEVFLTIAVPRPDAGSLMAEWLDGYLGWLASGWELAVRYAPRGSPTGP